MRGFLSRNAVVRQSRYRTAAGRTQALPRPGGHEGIWLMPCRPSPRAARQHRSKHQLEKEPCEPSAQGSPPRGGPYAPAPGVIYTKFMNTYVTCLQLKPLNPRNGEKPGAEDTRKLFFKGHQPGARQLTFTPDPDAVQLRVGEALPAAPLSAMGPVSVGVSRAVGMRKWMQVCVCSSRDRDKHAAWPTHSTAADQHSPVLPARGSTVAVLETQAGRDTLNTKSPF